MAAAPSWRGRCPAAWRRWRRWTRSRPSPAGCRSPCFSPLLAGLQRSLHRVFQYYRNVDGSDGRAQTINAKEFDTFVRDADLLDRLSFTKREAAAVFAVTQHAEGAEGASEMSFREFLEAVVTLALYKLPSPMQPAAQRLTLFVAEACAGDDSRLDPDLEKRLAALDQLCVGDFSAVKRQNTILDTQLEPAEFLELLEAEHRIKPEVREARGIGFMH